MSLVRSQAGGPMELARLQAGWNNGDSGELYVPYPKDEIQVEKHAGKKTLQVLCRPVPKKGPTVSSSPRTDSHQISRTTSLSEGSATEPSKEMAAPEVKIDVNAPCRRGSVANNVAADDTSDVKSVSNVIELQNLNLQYNTLNVRGTGIIPDLHGEGDHEATQSRQHRQLQQQQQLSLNRMRRKQPLKPNLHTDSSQQLLVKNLIRHRNMLLQDNLDLVDELTQIRNKFYEFFNDKMPRILPAAPEDQAPVAQQTGDAVSPSADGPIASASVGCLSNETNKLRAQLEDKERENESLKEEMASACREVVELKDRLEAMADDKADSDRQLQEQLETIAALEREAQEYKDTVASLQRQTHLHDLDLHILKSAKETAESDLKLTRSELESTVNARDWYQSEMRNHKEKSDTLLKDLMLCKDEVINLKALLEESVMKGKRLEELLREEKLAQLKQKGELISKLERLEDQGLQKCEDAKAEEKSKDEPEKELAAIRKKLAIKDSMVASQSTRIKKLEAEQARLKTMCKELNQTLTERQTASGQLELAVKQQADSIISLEQVKLECLQQRSKDEVALNQLTESKLQLEKEISSLNQQFSKVQVDFDQLTGSLAGKTAEIETLKQQLVDASEDSRLVSDLEAIITELEAEREQMKTEMEASKVLRSDLETSVSSLQTDLTMVNEAKARLESQVQALQVEQESIKGRLQALANDKIIGEKEHAKLLEQPESMRREKEQLESLRQEKEQLEAEKASLELACTNSTRLAEENKELRQSLQEMKLNMSNLETAKLDVDSKYSVLLADYQAEKGELDQVLHELNKVQVALQKSSLSTQGSDTPRRSSSVAVAKAVELVTNLTDSETIRTEANRKINEMETQIRQLSQQASDTDRIRGRLHEALQDLDRSRDVTTDLEAQLALANEALSHLQEASGEEQRGLRAELDFARVQVDNKSLELVKTMEALHQTQQANKAVNAKLDNIAKDLDELESEKERLITNNLLLTDEISELTDQLAVLRSTAAEWEAEKVAYASKLALLDKQCQIEIQRYFEELNDRVKEVEERLRGKEANLETVRQELSVGLKALHVDKNKLEQERILSQDKIGNLEQALTQANMQLESCKAELRQAKAANKDQEEFNKERIAKLQDELKAVLSRVAEMEAEKAKHQFELKQLNRALKTSLDHIRSLRNVLEEVPSLPPLDETSILKLLELDVGSPKRPCLASLKLCLADLREDVKQLTDELAVSRGNSPLHFRRLSSLSPISLSPDSPGYSSPPSSTMSPFSSPSRTAKTLPESVLSSFSNSATTTTPTSRSQPESALSPMSTS